MNWPLVTGGWPGGPARGGTAETQPARTSAVSNSVARRRRTERGEVESTGHIAIIPASPHATENLFTGPEMPEAPVTPTPTEVIEVTDRTVPCDGGGGALGHPRVFLYIEADRVLCPYCSRLYVLAAGAGHGSGH